MTAAELWDEYWSLARFYLHLSDDEFFRLTPRQLSLLVNRHKEQVEYQEYLAGLVAATIANYAGRMRKQGMSAAIPADFMFSRREPEKVKRLPRRVVANNIRAFLEARMAEQAS